MKAKAKRHYELDLMRWEGIVSDENGNEIPCGVLRTSRKQALQDAKNMIKRLEEK
jgi:ABC-type arginine transport system ATPase subunit